MIYTKRHVRKVLRDRISHWITYLQDPEKEQKAIVKIDSFIEMGYFLEGLKGEKKLREHLRKEKDYYGIK